MESKLSSKDLITKIEDSVFDVLNGEKFEKFIEFSLSFHEYSFRNQMLIFLQKPDATFVGSFSFWKSKNVFIKKGEKGIAILSPRIGKQGSKDSDDSKESNEEKTFLYFVTSYVFDISQTNATQDQIPALNNENNTKGVINENLFDLVKNQAENHFGVKIEKTNNPAILDEWTNGICIPSEKKIFVKSTNEYSRQVKTIFHELTHYVLHREEARAEDQTTSQQECEAELTACFLIHDFCDDTETKKWAIKNTSEYLAGWLYNGEKTKKEISSFLTNINKARKEITNAVNSSKPKN